MVDELYRKYGAVIYRRCMKILKDRAAAEDATQEVFLKLVRNLDDLEPGDGYLPWIYRTATNHCLNELRDNARLQIMPSELLSDEGVHGAAAALPERELAGRLLAAVDRQTRDIAVLALVDGLTQEEIADVLCLSRRTIGKKLRQFVERAQRFVARAS
jgi:RNA polymerase sigma-70 factor (ECF subfamily)